MLDWLDNIPLMLLVLAALLLALAPFVPEPHLWQKAKMLTDGTLTRPEDIFDVFFHSAGFVLVGLKLYRMRARPDTDAWLENGADEERESGRV